MSIEDVVEALNKYIKLERENLKINPVKKQHLVLQKIISPHPTFKAYKTYEYILWVISGSKKAKLLVLQHQAKCLQTMEELLLKELEIQFVCNIFDYVDKCKLDNIVYGEYPIPDE